MSIFSFLFLALFVASAHSQYLGGYNSRLFPITRPIPPKLFQIQQQYEQLKYRNFVKQLLEDHKLFYQPRIKQRLLKISTVDEITGDKMLEAKDQFVYENHPEHQLQEQYLRKQQSVL